MNGYEIATVCLSVFLFFSIILNIFGGVVVQKEWQITSLLAGSFAEAASNQNACDTVGVVCKFEPELIIVPALSVDSFSLATAKCSAQLIGNLAASQTAVGNVRGSINVKKARYMGRVPLF